MDGLSVVASIFAVIQVADRVISLCKFYLELARDAPSDLKVILIETSSLKTVLDNIHFLTCNGHGPNLTTLLGQYGPVEGCRTALDRLSGLFPSDYPYMHNESGDRSKRRKVKDAWTTLAWPLKESTARKLLAEVAQYKTTLNLALTADISHDIKAIKEKADAIHETLAGTIRYNVLEVQQREVYRWLDDIDPSTIHNRACGQYEAGTGNWVLRSEDWKAWMSGKKRALWVHGIPGAGKTVLASHLVETVKRHCNASTERKIASVYYYCYFGRNTDEASPFLKWTIRQLCRRIDILPAELYKLYKRGEQPSLADLLNLLETIVKPFDCVYIMLDAIDESMPRLNLLKVLRDIITDPRFHKIQVLATSREYIDIEESLKRISEEVSMRNPFLDADIRLFVQAQLSTHPKLSLWPASIREEAVEALSRKAEGMFRWVVCQIDILQRVGGNRDAILKALQNLPRGLDETYERIFAQIPDEARLFVHHALKWIYAHSALRTDNIYPSILIQATQRSTDGLDSNGYDYDYNEELLREFCGCLILVSPQEHVSISSKISAGVSFAHYTVLEFLNSTRIRYGPSSFFAINHEIVKLEYARMVMLETLDTKEHEFCNMELLGAEENKARIADAMEEEFNFYSIVSTIIATGEWESALSADDCLCDLVFAVFDVSNHHFASFKNAAACIEVATGNFSEYCDMDSDECFWMLDWRKNPTNNDVRTLVNLLVTAGGFDLGRNYIQRAHEENWLQSSFELELEMYRPFSNSGDERYVFKGAVVELFAVLARDRWEHLGLFLELGVGYFDPTKILLSSIGWHGHDEHPTCKDNCFLARILQLGADPNGHGYRISPLQIAVGTWELDGVRALLEAGADPNCSGDREGEVWEEDTILAGFNKLMGRSPLNILETMDCVFDGVRRRHREGEKPMIRELLHQYGARNFRASNLELSRL